jgi:hypothetical protein
MAFRGLMPAGKGTPGDTESGMPCSHLQSTAVMAGLVQACPGHPRGAAAPHFPELLPLLGVDARHKAGHDALGIAQREANRPAAFSQTAPRFGQKGGPIVA